MSSLAILDRELCSIVDEMRSGKVTQRQKAFEKLELILNSREDDILRYMAANKYDTNWKDILGAAHHGIKIQNDRMGEPNTVGALSAEGKSYIYIKVVQKVVDLAMNRNEPEISFDELIKRIIEVLNDSSMAKYFCVCYIQILQKHVLNTKWDLTVIRAEQWKDIIKTCFKLYEDTRLAKPLIVGCLRIAVQKSLDNCSVQDYLGEYLNPLAQMINECDRGKVLYELIRVAYYYALNLAVDLRYYICHFIKKIAHRLIKSYEPKMEGDVKTFIFRLMHIAVIVHNPEKNFTEWRSNQDLEFTGDRLEWNKFLRNFYYIIECEVKVHASASYDAASGRDVPFVDGFIDLAARLCYLVFWHDEVWLQRDEPDGNSAKRIKRANKLQSLMDLIEVDISKPNWRWFIILAEIVERCPAVVEENDYQPLLHLLSTIQPKLQFSSHVKSFRFCCLALLNYENNATFQKSVIIDKNQCAELWLKIIETCFRCSTSNNKCASDNHCLLRLLITHRKYPSATFLNSILNAFYCYSIDRKNVNIETIATILETIPLESLGNVQEMVEKLLNYIFPSSREAQAKAILNHQEQLDMKLLANVSINLSVTKHQHKDCEQAQKYRPRTKYFETNHMVRDIEENILLRSIQKLLEVNIIKQDPQPLQKAVPLVTYNIHEANFGMLCAVLNSEKHNPADKSLINIIRDIELFLVILNSFLAHNAFTKDGFEKCLLTKKLAFKIQEMDFAFGAVENRDLIMLELHEISTGLLVIFQGPYHEFINQMIAKSNFTNILKWILKNARNLPNDDSDVTEFLQYRKLSKQQLHHHNLLLVVAHYMKYHGTHTMKLQTFLDSTIFNMYNNLVIFHVMKMSEILVDHSSSLPVAKWILKHVKDICVAHHTNIGITEAIIDLFPKLITFVSPHDELFNDTITLFSSFNRKATMLHYSVNLQKKIHSQIKHLIKAFPDHYEAHKVLYTRMATLIASSDFVIKMTAVENLIHIFKDGWAFPADQIPSKFYLFQLTLYSEVGFKMDMASTRDKKQCTLSAFIQLLYAAMCSNYYLRKRAMLDLVEQISLSQWQPHKVQLLIKLINETGLIDPVEAVQNSLDSILELWITKNYKLETFPWSLTGSESYKHFLQKYHPQIAFAILRHKAMDIHQFCKAINKSLSEVVKTIITKCVAYIIPKWANCAIQTESYTRVARDMQLIIGLYLEMDKLFLEDESIVSVILHLLELVQDETLTKDVFEREVLTLPDEFVLSKENFKKCSGQLRVLICPSTSQSFFVYLCVERPEVIERIFFGLKLKIFQTKIIEEKMQIFVRYAGFMKELMPYLCQTRSGDMKQFLTRDICYFLCNTMISTKSLQIPVLNWLLKFIPTVIISCAEYFAPHLNLLTSSLFTIYNQNTSEELSGKIHAFLDLVVIKRGSLLGDVIGKLNYFPEDNRFNDVREALARMTAASERTLAEDISAIIQLPHLKYEELAALRGLLVNKKDELAGLCEELKSSNGFLENCTENVLMRLINTLLEEIRTDNNDKRTIESLRCLGEIGPVDLSTLILRSDAEPEIYENLKNTESAVQQFVRVLIGELNQLIVHKNLCVAEEATSVCYYLLQNSKFRGLAADFRTLFPYMVHPARDHRILERSSGPMNLTGAFESLSDSCSYESFVSTVATTLFEFLQDKKLKLLVDAEFTLASKMVSMLIQIVLSFNDGGLNEDIRTFVSKYFKKFKENSTSTEYIRSNLESVHLMLKIVECVRMYSQNHSQYKIELDYMPIASASLQCEAYFKAIMYCELWCMEQLNGGVNNDTIKNNPQLMDILKSAYSAIGVDEAARAFLDPITSRKEYYQQEQKHNLCLLYHDISSSSTGTSEMFAYRDALKISSLYGLANRIASDVDFDCAWRLADWTVPLDVSTKGNDDTVNWRDVFQKQHYKALKCLELKDQAATESAVFEGRKALSKMLKVASLESTKNIYPYLCKLRQLQQIEDFMNVHFHYVKDGEKVLIQKWNDQDKLPYSDFAGMEVILTQRVTILKTAGIRATRTWVPDTLNQARFHLIHEARTTGHHDVAMANICSMIRQPLSEDVKALVMLEDALLNWSIGDKFLSKRLVNEIVSGGKCKDLLVNAAAYRIYGTFLAETNVEDVHNLHKNFFNQSNALVEEALRQSSQQENKSSTAYQSKCLENDRNFIVLHTIAKYADREFVRLKAHFKSNDFKLRRMNLEKLKKEINMLDVEIQSLDDTDREKLSALRRARISAKQNATRDEESLKTMVTNMEDYLKMALLYYSSYTRKSSVESDLAVFRIVALWLGNHNVEIITNVREALKVVPSYKFVPVLPQLAPRLDNSAEGIGKIIEEILERCAIDHPHHTLPHIFAQVHAYADVESKDIPRDDKRLLGAQSLYKKLLKNQKISPIVNQMSNMSLAFIEMANRPLGSGRAFSSYKMSSRDTLKKCQMLDKVHCPTVELRVCESGIYNNIIGIHKWNDHIEGVGGINAPKKLICHCMDGQDRVQLIKGKDDMRQDAVMLQVFSILNVLLCNDKDANRKKLRVRTYKVVPLSRQSGILEWCSNTTTFGGWLVPAHERYRPKDLNPTDARKSFAEMAKSSLKTKQEKFLKICQRLSPVFQYYFFEKFLTPGMWFERRLSYTKSVAVSSMIGYILGIGDRHVQNLLVDEKTAEIIHIDFGIAFELGKNLPTPETIPFRLSRDMVAGMGVSGIEGVFKKSCEKTLEILRNNHAPIMTILEVLLYDPLYSWNVMSNKKAVREQRAEMYGGNLTATETSKEGAVNISAERALLRVSEKLNGKEDEKFTSVEGQVERLIFAATSNLNLCQLFHGWQPYL
ncbi:serine/threonine-protein kinase ATM [Toxorhynchites rutilus septentrionalis]|uniref:serine/threonine-protein kinase ATM n=1 Tax=Toxorhynchites rutilus septentrionalis TaxID=329112 RepID=UPI00247A4295|nr:serine/threonine-protein kinase ATM [Toxorhynchites rutilus septentrionalis]